MAHPRTFRFGVQLSTAPTGTDWSAMARRAEVLGYSTLFLPDHFGDQFAPVPARMAAADATTDLRIGSLVLDNDFKHPVVLAKEAASIDVLSGGRLELGLGAGWMNTDYEQSGIRKDPAGIRVGRMGEAVAVLKGLFADGPFSFEGDHYRISALEGLPKPVQRPHPPLILGGGGRRMLSIAAREAQIVGVNPALKSGNVDVETAQDATAEATDRKLGWVREAAGSRFDDIELNCLILATMTADDYDGTLAMMATMFGLSPEQAAEVPHILLGDAARMTDALHARRDRWGFSYFVVQGLDAMEALAPVVADLTGT
jgi:probable F420-dependent oxidoreductase